MVRFISEPTMLSMLNGLRLKSKEKRSQALNMKKGKEKKSIEESARLKKRYSILEEVALNFSNISTQEISRFHLSSTFLQEFQLQSYGTTNMWAPHQNVKLDTRSKQFYTLTVENNWSISNWLWFMNLQLSFWLDMKA